MAHPHQQQQQQQQGMARNQMRRPQLLSWRV
jgi:hypothetical protein